MSRNAFARLCGLFLSSFSVVVVQARPVPPAVPKDSIVSQLTHQLRGAKQDTSQLILVTQLLNRYVELNHIDSNTPYLQRGFQIARRTTDPLLLGRFYAQAGEYYQRLVNYPKVVNSFKLAIHYLQQTIQKKDITRAMYRLARAYHYREMMVQALRQVDRNLAYAQQLNCHQYDVANYALLYTFYAGRNDKNKALAVLKRMVSVAQQLKSPKDLYLAYANFGEWYDLRHQYSKGLPYHRKALAGILSQGSVDINYVSQSYYTITNNLLQQNRLSEAQSMVSQAIRLNQQAGIVIPGNLFRVQALILERQHRLVEAYQWMNRPLVNFRKRNPSELIAVLEILIRIQQKRGCYQDAFLLLKEQKLVNDSLQQVEKHKALATLEARAELNKQTHQVTTLKKNIAINQLELIRIHQQQLLIGVLALSLLLLALGGGWAAKAARTHADMLQQQTQQIRLQALHLQELNDIKDKLFSVIGHDLRTPVLYLRSSLEQLSQPATDRQRFDQLVNQLRRSVNTIYSTLDNLLHWSALQRNLLVTRLVVVNLDTLVQQVLLLLEPVITQKMLVVKLNEGPLWAWVDDIQAQIILRNIIHNACKFTPAGGQISIDYQTVGDESLVKVTDTGIGMPTMEQRQPQQGTGLGLVVTQEFLALNSGRLVISSQLDKGTEVQLFFLQTVPVERILKRTDPASI